MVQKSLTLIVTLVLSSCGTTQQQRLSDAKTVIALANAPTPQFNAPAVCTAEMPLVQPTQQEPRVMLHQRWLFVRDNENQGKKDCGAAIADYNHSMQPKSANTIQ
jgi:hypothetical protein